MLESARTRSVDDDKAALQRLAMVENQIEAEGVKDARVLSAMRDVPRHRFVLAEHLELAHADRPLPIGHGQTISQPRMVAIMTALLADLPRGAKVLEIGSGSGYQTAILVSMGFEVHAVELLDVLVEKASQLLDELDLAPATLRVGDGNLGLPEHAPYDCILAAACAAKLPKCWRSQLGRNGRIVAPVEARGGQQLMLWRRKGIRLSRSKIGSVVFVPLVKP